MTNSISKWNKTKTKPWKTSITKINTSKNWNKNALPRTLAFEVWRTKNTGFWGLKNLLTTQLSQLAPSQAASNYPATPWSLPNPRPIHSQIKHIVGQLLPISPLWNPKLKSKTLNKKDNKKSTQSSQSQPQSPNRQNLDSTQQLKRDLACCRLVSKTVNALTHEVPKLHLLCTQSSSISISPRRSSSSSPRRSFSISSRRSCSISV